MYITMLSTYYEIYAIGDTLEEVKANLVKGYKKMYPRKEDRSVSRVTFNTLDERFGIHIYNTGKRGYAIEGEGY